MKKHKAYKKFDYIVHQKKERKNKDLGDFIDEN